MPSEAQNVIKALAEGLYLGGISEESKAHEHARHLVGFLRAEGFVVIAEQRYAELIG